MKCDVKTPLTQIADAIIKGRVENIISGLADTQQEILNRLQLFKNSFQIRWKDASLLRDKKIPTVNNQVRVYGVVGQEADIERSFTLQGKINFIKAKGAAKADELSADVESIIKRESGTAIHSVMEQLINYFISNEYKDKVLSTELIPMSLEDIKKILPLSSVNFDKLAKTARALIDNAIKIQNTIDSTQKPIIVTEQILGSGNMMGTSDLIVVYSDKSASHYDYKTMVPKNKYVTKVDGEFRINSMSWIPFYKYKDWGLQLPNTTDALLKTMGVTRIRESRNIPIQVQLKFEKGKITDKILSLNTFATSEEFLDPVAIQEKSDNKPLELQLEKLNRIKLKKIQEIGEIKGSSVRKEQLSAEVNKLTISINKLQVKNDNRWLINDYEELVRRYGDLTDGVFRKLKDVSNIENEETYLDLKDLRDLKLELEAFSGILSSTGDYFLQLGIPEEEVKVWENRRSRLQDNTLMMIDKLEQKIYGDIKFKKTSIEEIENAKDESFTSKLFNTFSEIEHPIFKEAFNLISNAKNESRIELQGFKQKLTKVAKVLEDYSKSSGLGLFGAYDLLINRNTGNLHAKYSKEFYEGLKKNQEASNSAAIDEVFQLKEDAQEKYQKFLDRVSKNLNFDLTTKEGKKRLEAFKQANTLESFKLNSRDIWKYYEIKPSKQQENYSPEYKKISTTPALNQYYNFWAETMSDFRSRMGFNSYSELPSNFIPNFRAEMLETLFRDGSLNLLENLGSLINITQDDLEFGDFKGKQDVVTGEILAEIPTWGMRPIYTKDGVIDNNLKSYDLNKVLYTFAEVALNYESMAKIQTEIDILGDIIGKEGIQEVNSNGKLLKTISNSYVKVTGQQLEISKLFKQHILYSMYGVSNQDKDKKVGKVILTLNQGFVLSKLAFSPITQFAASGAAKINQYFEGVKSYYYTKEQLKEAEKSLVGVLSGKDELSKLSIGYFEFDDKRLDIKATELPSNKILNLSQRGLSMIGFRKGSEWIDNSIGLAMMQNYGIDENGNIKRISSLTDKRSLKDRRKIVDGKFEIEGLTLDGYTQFRNMVRQISRGIKGELTSGDMRAIQMNTYGKLFMTFKSWLPDLFKERFGEVKYQTTTDAVTIGKLNAIWKSNLKPEHKNFLGILGETLMNLTKLLVDISTFGFVKQFKTNEARARQLLNKLKEDNPNNQRIQDFSEQDFIDYMNGQIRSSVTELRMYLAFILLVMALGGDWDDDGEKDYKKNLVFRATYRSLNRIRRELGFFYGSEGLSILTKNSVPISGLLTTSLNLVENSFDETRDALMGENNERDKANFGHYALQLFPGGRPIFDIFLLDEAAEKKEF